MRRSAGDGLAFGAEHGHALFRADAGSVGGGVVELQGAAALGSGVGGGAVVHGSGVYRCKSIDAVLRHSLELVEVGGLGQHGTFIDCNVQCWIHSLALPCRVRERVRPTQSAPP